ncbi:phosphatase PAP2 family protein [Phreatobacter stygius]|uniref:Phosphatase PAP2 family protein n=1 Tax=Phreatobacter stygius TaxID=1940610 RepID=A0A4D7B773_9HYPH|nr:phosphatase PAP2 family protein [Phreatobacter stygius]QCI68831.1 phosphatase PAP2 family protein [Phreatobacter stygius]
MSPIDTPPLTATPASHLSLRGRLAASSEAFLAGMRRLGRPVRPNAAPALQLFEDWAAWASAVLVGTALVLASMAYIDPVIQRGQHAITGGLALFFEIVTDLGKSGWLLWPTGIVLIVILAVMPPVRSFADRVVLALAARLAFLFIAVGGSGLIIAIVKRIIGRARPRYFEEFGALHFDLTAWKASYASFPSGHSQTAFAIAVALACLAPRWRKLLLVIATLVALSRIVVDAHYFTDIVVGSAWGAWFTIMTRDWFARRGFVFAPGPGRRPFPMPRRRVVAALATLGRRLKP